MPGAAVQTSRDDSYAYAADPAIRAAFGQLREAENAGRGPVLFIGMGASLCSSVSGAVFLQTHGRPSFVVDAGEWLHYGAAVRNDPALSILLTTSGESAELVELFKRGASGLLALISNNSASTCWKLAESKLPILAGPEYGNATKTYTNATAASIIAAAEILGLPWEKDAEKSVEIFSTNLERIFDQRGYLEQFCRGAANTEIIGRGAGFGAAQMSALCIREMTGHRAAAHTGAGFRHGPNLDVDASHVAIIFALGRAAELGVKLAQECNRRGGKVVLVSEEDRELNGDAVSGTGGRGSRALGGNYFHSCGAGSHAGDGREDGLSLASALRIRGDGAVARGAEAGQPARIHRFSACSPAIATHLRRADSGACR